MTAEEEAKGSFISGYVAGYGDADNHFVCNVLLSDDPTREQRYHEYVYRMAEAAWERHRTVDTAKGGA